MRRRRYILSTYRIPTLSEDVWPFINFDPCMVHPTNAWKRIHIESPPPAMRSFLNKVGRRGMESGSLRQAMHILASLERHVHRRNWGLDGTIGGEAGNADDERFVDVHARIRNRTSLQGPLIFREAWRETSMKNISATTAGSIKA